MSKHISLAAFTPTDEEIGAARTLLRAIDAKMKISKQNSLTQFLSGNKGGKGNEELLALKPGEEKTEAIATCIAYKNAKKRQASLKRSQQHRGQHAIQRFHPDESVQDDY